MLTKRQEARIRSLAGESRCPVVVIAGDSAPQSVGERAYSEFAKSGGRCEHPGSAMRAGYKVRYIHSTLRVEVGDVWLARQPWGSKAPLSARQKRAVASGIRKAVVDSLPGLD